MVEIVVRRCFRLKKKWGGFVGKILRINLTKKRVTNETLNEEVARSFLGGVGYAAKILWDELEPGIDPLSPENKLIMATGPLTGTLCPSSGGWEACFKSPQTNCWGESRCGGGWGPELKYAGFDMVTLEGASQKPVFIWICDGKADIRSAEHLVGKTVPDTENTLKEEVGERNARVASIGPAGEKLVRFANIMCDYERAAGRCGGGAVMGSKNVKAVVVRGHGEIPVANPEAFRAAIEEAEDDVLKHPWRPDYRRGTIYWLPILDAGGDHPTKYGASNSWGGKGDDTLRLFERNYLMSARACPACMLGCGRICEVKTGKWATPPYGGVEYETAGVFTSFILNDDVEALIHANYLCNIYGLDTISCGNVIGLAMECYNRGWITKRETDNIELTWGNMDAVVAIIEKIARREGFGDALAEGTKNVAQKIGKGAPDIALHVKGLDIPMHDPRGGKTLALQYGTANRGMCHMHPHEVCVYERDGLSHELEPYGLPKQPDRYAEEGKGVINKILQDFGMIPDILGVCKFPIWAGLTLKNYTAMTSSAVGWNISDVELLKIGERVFNLQRCFNIREGIRRKDDLIPKRICEIPTFGPYSHLKEAAIVNYEGMLDEYYEAREWEKTTGIPTPEKLKELAMGDVADQLTKYVK